MNGKEVLKHAKMAVGNAVGKTRAVAPGLGSAAYKAGRAASRSKVGKRVLTGAAAGGAVGAALPFVSLAAGAMLGAGALVLWKSFKDKD
jgi:hypothetical protein